MRHLWCGPIHVYSTYTRPCAGVMLLFGLLWTVVGFVVRALPFAVPQPILPPLPAVPAVPLAVVAVLPVGGREVAGAAVVVAAVPDVVFVVPPPLAAAPPYTSPHKGCKSTRYT